MKAKYDALIRVRWGLKARIIEERVEHQSKTTQRKAGEDTQQSP